MKNIFLIHTLYHQIILNSNFKVINNMKSEEAPTVIN